MAAGTYSSRFFLLWTLTRREIAARYRGSVLGVLWALVTPLLMLGVYTLVFGFVFKARWGGTPLIAAENNAGFSLMLFSGLLLHGWFSEILMGAPALVLSNSNYVKRVVFPLPVLMPVLVGRAGFQFLVGLAVLFAGMFWIMGSIPWTALYVPVVLLPFVVLMLGVGWWLASLGVYLRDIAQLMSVLTTILLFLSTIFYPAEALPELVRDYVYFNPLSYIVDELRRVTLWGQVPLWSVWLKYLAVSILVAISGYVWFRKTQRGFADVL
ncbi:MAG: ABC transporter permease [Hyphomicrobiales bacterium]|nr:ABC transporter permease [Rickettsiales bacterium]MCP5361048.1 ABC transporter permease [Hyphomicrobiales bacterium]